MASPRYRLVALDLDGTVLAPDHSILPSTRAAIADAMRKGVECVIATGRHHTAAAPFQHGLGLDFDTPAICCNGTYVWDYGARRALAGDPLTREEARVLLRLCRAHDLHWLIYTGDAMNYEVETEHLRDLAAWSAKQDPAWRPVLRRVDDFEQLVEETEVVWKFFVAADDEAGLTDWLAAAEETGFFGIEQSWRARRDVVRVGNTKGRRLVDWAASRGIAADEIIAIGDNLNDLGMINAAGLGIAMGNAEPALKDAADWVTTANDADGIAVALERFLS